MKSIMQPLYNFVRFCSLCIAITINLFLPISRWYLELVGLFKYLVWCHIFEKCQNLGGNNEKYYAALYNFVRFCSLCIAITINLFLPISRWYLELVGLFKYLVWCHIFGKCQNLGGTMKSIMQPLYNFVRFCNLCIAITINLFLPISRWYLELVGLFKYLVWCHIFEKCQNLGINNEKYYAATILFCKILQFVHCNYHKFIFANQ